MPLRYLIDENSRHRALVQALGKHNSARDNTKIDFVFVGGPNAPASGTSDVAMIEWAAANGRVIISRDAKTLISAHTKFVADGNETPGLLILRRGLSAAARSLFHGTAFNLRIDDAILAAVIIDNQQHTFPAERQPTLQPPAHGVK